MSLERKVWPFMPIWAYLPSVSRGFSWTTLLILNLASERSERCKQNVSVIFAHSFLVFGPDLAFWGTETKSETPTSFIISFKTSFKTSFKGMFHVTLPSVSQMFGGPIVCLWGSNCLFIGVQLSVYGGPIVCLWGSRLEVPALIW